MGSGHRRDRDGRDGKAASSRATPIPATASNADYAGEYAGPFKLRVTVVSDHLFVEVAEWPVTRLLTPTGRDEFRIGDFDEPLKFERDSSGRVTGAVWGVGDAAMHFRAGS